jgi:hypothetical protein
MPLVLSRLASWLFGLACCAAVIFAYVYEHPRISFSPFCGSSFAYRLNVTIEFSGKQYSSEVIGELMHNRINTGGVCRQPIGSIIPFRLEDNRLVVLYAHICDKAVEVFTNGHGVYDRGNLADQAFLVAMNEHRKIDLAPLCIGINRVRPARPIVGGTGYDGFIIDNADNPTRWRGFIFDHNPNSESVSTAEQLRIVSASAEARDIAPDDGLEKIAPAILKTTFQYREWTKSPEAMFYSQRERNYEHIHNATEEQP